MSTPQKMVRSAAAKPTDDFERQSLIASDATRQRLNIQNTATLYNARLSKKSKKLQARRQILSQKGNNSRELSSLAHAGITTPDSNEPNVSYTISQDQTAGEKVRRSRLLATLGRNKRSIMSSFRNDDRQRQQQQQEAHVPNMDEIPPSIPPPRSRASPSSEMKFINTVDPNMAPRFFKPGDGNMNVAAQAQMNGMRPPNAQPRHSNRQMPLATSGRTPAYPDIPNPTTKAAPRKIKMETKTDKDKRAAILKKANQNANNANNNADATPPRGSRAHDPYHDPYHARGFKKAKQNNHA